MKEGTHEKDQAEPFDGQPKQPTLSTKELYQLAADQAQRSTELTQRAHQHLRAMQEPSTEEGGLSEQSMGHQRGQAERFDGQQNPFMPGNELLQQAYEQSEVFSQQLKSYEQLLKGNEQLGTRKASNKAPTEEVRHSEQSMRRKRDLTDDDPTSSSRDPKRRKDDITQFSDDFSPSGQPISTIGAGPESQMRDLRSSQQSFHPTEYDPYSQQPMYLLHAESASQRIDPGYEMTDPRMMSSGLGEAKLSMTGPAFQPPNPPYGNIYAPPNPLEATPAYGRDPQTFQEFGASDYLTGTRQPQMSQHPPVFGGREPLMADPPQEPHEYPVDQSSPDDRGYQTPSEPEEPPKYPLVLRSPGGERYTKPVDDPNRAKWGKTTNAWRKTHGKQMTREIVNKKGKTKIVDVKLTAKNLLGAETRGSNPGGFTNESENRQALQDAYNGKRQRDEEEHEKSKVRYENTNEVRNFLEEYGIAVPVREVKEGKRIGQFITAPAVLAEAQRMDPDDQELQQLTLDNLRDAQDVKNLLEERGVTVQVTKWETVELHTPAEILAEAQRRYPNNQELRDSTAEDFYGAEEVKNFLEEQEIEVPTTRKVPKERLWTASAILVEAQSMNSHDQELQKLTLDSLRDAKDAKTFLEKEHGVTVPVTRWEIVKLHTPADILAEARRMNPNNQELRDSTAEDFYGAEDVKNFLEEQEVEVPTTRKVPKEQFWTASAILAEAQRMKPNDQELQELTLERVIPHAAKRDAQKVINFLKEKYDVKVPPREKVEFHTRFDILAEAQRKKPNDQALQELTLDNIYDTNYMNTFLEEHHQVKEPKQRKGQPWTAADILAEAQRMKPDDQALQMLTLDSIYDMNYVRRYLNKHHRTQMPPWRMVELDTPADILAKAQRMKPDDQALQRLTLERVIPLAQGQRTSTAAEQGEAGPATMHEETGIPAGTRAPSELMGLYSEEYAWPQGDFGAFDPRGFAK